MDDPEYSETGRMMPRSSPGRSTPVGLPKPNSRTQWSKRFSLSSRPILMAPTFEDCARIWEVVSASGPRTCDSPMVRSATWIVGGRSKTVSGVTLRSCSAPATVNALNVDPGS